MLRKDDQVQVMAGKDKGKTGKILAILDKHDRVLVEKVNLVRRHTKPTQKNPQGGILEKEHPIHVSNVLLLCGKCNKGVRHGMKLSAGKKGEQTKSRVCKKCGETLGTKSK